MALINCPKCNKEISDRGQICPYCKQWLDDNFLAQKRQELIDEGERQYKLSYAYEQDLKRQKQEEKKSLLPECPICQNKNNVKRISNVNRSLSIFLNGLASSKIGKQYECTHCKHKW
ncbi:MAG: hypothetical protein E7393_03905 [Ruminococcaceae bacterium]|nr:hypothetical protein [Oscillospiraceae bacterium]